MAELDANTFKVGDKAVYPAHGVGEVMAIENRCIGGHEQMFYVLRILDNGMKIMVPTNNVSQVGMRCVIGKNKVERVYNILRRKGGTSDSTTWNRRYRGYMDKIKTGSIFDVAEVLRELYLLKRSKDLSFCELKLMDTARSLLCREVAAAQNSSAEDVRKEFESIFYKDAESSDADESENESENTIENIQSEETHIEERQPDAALG